MELVDHYVSDILSKEFLSKYVGKQPDWGFGGLGYIIAKRTYLRTNPLGNSEEWWELVARCINGAQRIGAKYTREEAERLYDHLFNFRGMFSGRAMWQLGTPLVDNQKLGDSLLNCFAGETKVLTRNGWFPIESLAGTNQTIVTSQGKWTNASIKCFGRDSLYEVVFKEAYSRGTIRIYATEDHEWIVNNKSGKQCRVKTKDLNTKHTVPIVLGKRSSEYLSPQGIQHGLVFGDGSCNGIESFIDLIGDTYDDCHKYFALNRISWTNPDNPKHVRFGGMPNFYKSLPSITENKSYLMGFMAGWIAADGSVNRDGSIRLFNKFKDVIDKAKDILSVVGIRSSPPYLERDTNPYTGEYAELWAISLNLYDNPEFLILKRAHLDYIDNRVATRKQKRNALYASIVSVTKTNRNENVYCAVVPETHSFVIEGNILTGNCWSTKASTIEDFCFIFMESMFGGGVGINISKEFTFELPRVKRGVRCRLKNTRDADFIVPDSKEGWCELWRQILSSYLITGKSFTYSTVCIRSQGEPLRTFGGVAPGPMPLIKGTEILCSVLEEREGKKLRTQDIADIICIGGEVVKSGGVRRCLPETAIVHTRYGLESIKNVKVGDLVLTHDGYKKVSNHFVQGRQNLVRILTEDGYFDCTPDHRMAVLTDTHNHKWVEAQSLQDGDMLISTRVPVEGSTTKLPDWSYTKPPGSTTCKDIVIPELDTDMAWLIAIIHRLSKTDSKGSVSIAFNTTEHKLATKCQRILQRFGINVRILKIKDKNTLSVRCESRQLAFYLHKYLKKPNTTIRVPEFIYKAKQDIKLAYICGVMDGDGCVSAKPLNIVTTVYPEFARDIQNLLYSCGIESRYVEKKTCPSRPNNWKRIYKVNIITKHSRDKIIDCGFSEKPIRKNQRTHMSNGYPECYENTNICPVRVISVINIEPQETYDIEVEDNHVFFCNGYLTHNTALILQGDPDDTQFLNLKRWDLGNIPYYRSNSNNSILAPYFSYIPDKLWDGYKGNGEAYGFVNLRNARRMGRAGETSIDGFKLEEPNIISANPCLPAWASILTPDGIRTIGEVSIGDKVWSETGWTTIVNKWSTGVNKVYEYKTTAGSFYSTENHRVVSGGEKLEIKDADSIDTLTGPYSKSHIIPEIVMDGLVFGDGSVHKASNNLVYLNIGKSDSDYFDSEISSLIKRARPGLADYAYEISTSITHDEIPLTWKRSIPDRYIWGNVSEKASFLRGLFSANGSICSDRVCLKAASFKVIQQVQTMLSSLGIRSYYTTNKAKEIEFSNGTYTTKQSYDINISTDRGRFLDVIGFIQVYKTEKLQQIVDKPTQPGRTKVTYDVISRELVSEEETFDITVDNHTHTFWCNGFNISNCAEALLCDKEPCNLAEIPLNRIDSLDIMIDVAKLLYKTQKAIASMNYYHEDTNKIVHKNMKLGLSVTGVCDRLDVYQEWCDKTYRELRQFDKEWSRENNWPQSIRLTVVQPSGTKSLITGSKPGGHPGYSKYHIRRVRFAANDPLLELVKNMGIHTEYELTLDGQERHDVVVASFPCKFESDTGFQNDMSAIQQLELVKSLQSYWADQAVSVTVYYKPEELDDIKKWLEENYDEYIKSVSFLLHKDHGFKQPPLEPLDEATYNKMIKKTKNVSEFLGKADDSIGSEECENGACPVK